MPMSHALGLTKSFLPLCSCASMKKEVTRGYEVRRNETKWNPPDP